MNKDYIIFDFDGTIADTINMGLEIFNQISGELKLDPISDEELELIKANRPQDLLKSYGFSKAKLASVMLRLRKEMNKTVPNIKLIPGIKEALNNIKQLGYNLGILTSNSLENVTAFLENNQLTHIFDFTYSGKNLFGKKRLIKRMLRREAISKKNVIYIGDEIRDIEACKKARIPIISVTWGLNNRELLESAQPNLIIDAPSMLLLSIERLFENRGKYI